MDIQILPGRGKDVIIGMPSLIVDYGYLYLDLMTTAVEAYGRTDTLTLRPDGYEEREYPARACPVSSVLSNFTYEGLVPPEGAVSVRLGKSSSISSSSARVRLYFALLNS